MIWIFVGIIAILLLSFYNLVAKLFSSEISSLYAIPFVSLGVFIAGMISILTTKVISIENLKFSINGAALAIFAGLLWGLGGIFYFLMFWA